MYIRYQSRPVVAAMDAAAADRINLTDCAGSTNNQNQILESATFRAGRGWQRNIVTNVFSLDPITRELRCQGYGGGGAQPLLRDVAEFKVFYRFDDAARAAGANGVTNAAPFGGSIRDAAYIKTLEGGVIDPWNYVVAILVCLTITTDEQGTGATTVNTRASRCPNDAGEAETGLDLFTSTSDGRIRRTFSQVFTVRARELLPRHYLAHEQVRLLRFFWLSLPASAPHDRRGVARRSGGADRIDRARGNPDPPQYG